MKEGDQLSRPYKYLHFAAMYPSLTTSILQYKGYRRGLLPVLLRRNQCHIGLLMRMFPITITSLLSSSLLLFCLVTAARGEHSWRRASLDPGGRRRRF